MIELVVWIEELIEYVQVFSKMRYLLLIILAGFPPIIELLSYFPLVRTAPAHIIEPAPTTTPSRMVTFDPIQTFSPISIPSLDTP